MYQKTFYIVVYQFAFSTDYKTRIGKDNLLPKKNLCNLVNEPYLHLRIYLMYYLEIFFIHILWNKLLGIFLVWFELLHILEREKKGTRRKTRQNKYSIIQIYHPPELMKIFKIPSYQDIILKYFKLQCLKQLGNHKIYLELEFSLIPPPTSMHTLLPIKSRIGIGKVFAIITAFKCYHLIPRSWIICPLINLEPGFFFFAVVMG